MGLVGDIFSNMKTIHFVKYMNQILDGENTPPITLELDPTNRCNFHCPHCTDSYLHDNKELNANTIVDAMKQARHIGTRSIVIKGGGEPTTHKGFIYMLGATPLSMEVGMVSNGYNLREEKIRRAVVSYCNWIRVSLDAATAKTHAKMHGVGLSSYPSVISSLRVLNKERVGRKLVVGVNFCITDDNYNEIFTAAETSKDIGCDYISIRFAQIEGNKTLSPRCLMGSVSLINNCKQLESNNFHINCEGSAEGFYWKRRWLPLREAKHEWIDCVAPYLSAQILANGDVIPCCFLKPYKEFVYGNITKNRFDEIWMSPQHKKVISMVKKHQCEKHCRGRASSARFDNLNKVFSLLKNGKEPEFL
jgi:radical SAM protein with 4Fe4S-binding SPASM domain